MPTDKYKVKKARITQRKKLREQLRDALDRSRALLIEEGKHLEQARERLQNAEEKGHDNRGDDLADKIEVIRSRLEQTRDEIESIEARLLKLNKVIARLAKWLKKARKRAQKRLANKKYYASPNFRYDEFDCRDGTKVPEAAYEALRHLCSTYLEPLRARYGTIIVHSGYRTPTYNASVGGASDSIHIYTNHPNAVAADHTAAGASPSTVANFEDNLDPGGLGRYASFTHIDNRQRIGYAEARWWG